MARKRITRADMASQGANDERAKLKQFERAEDALSKAQNEMRKLRRMLQESLDKTLEFRAQIEPNDARNPPQTEADN
jgi:hypothetical protein